MSKRDDVDPRTRWVGSNGGGTGWGWDEETGRRVMPERQDKFLEWMLSDPRLPATQHEWAEENGVHKDSLRRWKRDPKFIAEWEERARQKNISVDRVQSVVDALYNQATSGDVKAAQLYLQYIDRFTPKMKVVNEDASTKGLSDAELLAELDSIRDDLSFQ